MQIPNFPGGFGASPSVPLIYPSCLHSVDQEIQISISLWGFSPRPLINPSFLHSKDHEITTHWSTKIKNFPGSFAPSSPPLSFLFTFNRPWDTTHYSTNIKFFPGGFTPRPPYLSFLFTFNRPGYTTHYCANTKFSLGLCPQFPSFILPFYIQ